MPGMPPSLSKETALVLAISGSVCISILLIWGKQIEDFMVRYPRWPKMDDPEFVRGFRPVLLAGMITMVALLFLVAFSE